VKSEKLSNIKERLYLKIKGFFFAYYRGKKYMYFFETKIFRNNLNNLKISKYSILISHVMWNKNIFLIVLICFYSSIRIKIGLKQKQIGRLQIQGFYSEHLS